MILVCFAVLKSDLMAALNKEVKSLDEDSWMFDGPRSRINLVSKPGKLFDYKMLLFGLALCLFLFRLSSVKKLRPERYAACQPHKSHSSWKSTSDENLYSYLGSPFKVHWVKHFELLGPPFKLKIGY